MTIDAPSRLFEEQVDNALRFSPNYSVYLLRRTSSALFGKSEVLSARRAYCAVAERIGAGESRASILGALSSQFPVARIEEAFTRLVDRGFVLPQAWPRMRLRLLGEPGLRPEAAAQNLRSTAVRIESVGVNGQTEFAEALRKFGVRVDDEAGDLTAVLVGTISTTRWTPSIRDNSRERRTGCSCSRRRVSAHRPDLQPGKSACWRCLADR